jgi:hypothetical protein
MRRSVAAVLGVLGGLLAAAAFIRRRTARADRVDLYYEDGSMLSLGAGNQDADRLLSLARDVISGAR